MFADCVFRWGFDLSVGTAVAWLGGTPAMKILSVRHVTSYRYARPVAFGDHRLMFRPRDSHDLRLLRTSIVIEPQARVRWMHDVFGNSVAIASFDTMASVLRFESTIELEHYGAEGLELPVASYAATIPFSYCAEEIPDLGRTMERHHSDPEHVVDAWARKFLKKRGATPTLELLHAMTYAIRGDFAYAVRQEEGCQSPVETLQKKSGACRDFALLFMEACRSLGLAARFVSGYLYDAGRDSRRELQGGGHTHAWAQIYVPGCGWVELDPTNGLVGGPNLIRVAVARDPGQAVPLSGTFVGTPSDFLGMTVDVRVTEHTKDGARTTTSRRRAA
jgi:transglutaminase-like putative cysteine protease